MELRWLKLARSYQFAEQLRTFTSHNNQQRGQLTERLEQLRRKLETGSFSRVNKPRVPE
jgi:exonuclease VII large subunit